MDDTPTEEARGAWPPAHRRGAATRGLRRAAASLLLAAAALNAHAAGGATTLDAQLAGWRAEAGAAVDDEAAAATRGQRLFTTSHGREWSCASCHGERPTTPGRHAATGKAIAPLAPAAEAARFTDAAKTEKWFRRNCTDVLGRACSAREKADVATFLRRLGGSS